MIYFEEAGIRLLKLSAHLVASFCEMIKLTAKFVSCDVMCQTTYLFFEC